METPSSTPAPSLDLCSILQEELQNLRGAAPTGPQLDRLAALRNHYATVHRLEPNRLSALCLSGGGIRSATFSLGVLQGLAARGQLTSFDYLSTVSGGGYIGGWLSAWISRRNRNTAGVQESLNAVTEHLIDPEPNEILQLRAFSNYLSPKVGFFSADSWALIGTVARNILLNWLILVPLIAALLLVPRLHYAALLHFTQSGGNGALMVAGAVFACLSILYSRRALPRNDNRNYTQKWFLIFCVLPLFAAAYCLSCSWAGLLSQGKTIPDWMPALFPWDGATLEWVFFLGFGIVVHMFGYWPSFFGSKFYTQWRALGDFTAVLASGALGGALWLFLNRAFLNGTFDPLAYACWSIPAILLILLTAACFYIALTSFISTDEDREWWSRAGGWVLLGATLTAVFNLLIFYGLAKFFSAGTMAQSAIGSAGGLGGLAAILLGMSKKTPYSGKEPKEREENAKGVTLLSILAKLAAPLLVLFMLLLIGIATNLLIDALGIGTGWSQHFLLLRTSSLSGLLLLLAGFAAVFVVMGWFVNVNKFSLHAMYRSRLIRAYLAASRKEGERKPNLFTGFDPKDNLPMWDLKDQKPLHVVNVALNLVAGKKLAWQQRKAESFTITPLHCGSACICNKDQPDRYGAYRSSEEFALKGTMKPISLGTAVTISGAAANPNMGYNSSALLTFLMTFFNARLGCWLGNPGQNKWREPGPIYGLYYLALEALGQTTDERNYVNLSDGGHFDNLGLYEMVLRRCGSILVVDGGCDPHYRFEDLANVIRKIRVDLGIQIEIDLNPIRTKADHFATGWINYDSVDRVQGGPRIPDGKLIYIKAVLTAADLSSDPNELLPADVRQYGEANPPFPHQPTSDQFFDESQFESYRRLGRHSADRLFAGQQPVWDEI